MKVTHIIFLSIRYIWQAMCIITSQGSDHNSVSPYQTKYEV